MACFNVQHRLSEEVPPWIILLRELLWEQTDDSVAADDVIAAGTHILAMVKNNRIPDTQILHQ